MSVEILDLQHGVWEPLVDITLGNTRLLLDASSNLPMLDAGRHPCYFSSIPAAYPVDFSCVDWAIFGQPRQDLAALLDGPLADTPVLVGPETGRLLEFTAQSEQKAVPELAFGFQPWHAVQLGDIRITPIKGQYSGGDGCAFLLQGSGQAILLMTGSLLGQEEFRKIHELTGGRLDLLIAWEGQPANTDTMATELENIMNAPGTVFVTASPLDEPMIQAVTQAAGAAERTVWEDSFQRNVRQKQFSEDTQLFHPEDPTSAVVMAGLPDRKVIFLRPSMLPFWEAYLDADREKARPVVYDPSRQRCLPSAALLDACTRWGISYKSGNGRSRFHEQLERAEAFLQPKDVLNLQEDFPDGCRELLLLSQKPVLLLQELVRRADLKVLASALKGTPPSVRHRFISLMEPSQGEKFDRRLQSIWNLRFKDVTRFQWELLNLADYIATSMK